MPFSDFIGNSEIVHRLRDMLARDRLPHAVVLAGSQGCGKYTLALMLSQALNCVGPAGDPQRLKPSSWKAENGTAEAVPFPKRSSKSLFWMADGLPDFCGRCTNCTRIALSADLDARFAEAVEARENLRDADKKETRIFVQTHPDVLIIPPDPPQMMIKVDQVRKVIESIYYRPAEGRERVYIFTDSAFMKEAANSLLKVLEEPPEFATIFLLTENPGELLPTIRSRSMVFTLCALSAEEIESDLAKYRPEWKPAQRALVARLSEGAIGRARGFDVAAYTVARDHALAILNSGLRGGEHSELFKVTESYRPGAEGREKTEQLIRTMYSLLRDLMFLKSGAPEMIRNTDVAAELKRLAEDADFDWITAACDRLAEVERGMRRNLLRSLSLDAFATAMER
jgi:DNA polymerase III subunit delta'